MDILKYPLSITFLYCFSFLVTYEESGSDYKGNAESSAEYPVNTWYKMTLTCTPAHPATCKAYFDDTQVATFTTTNAGSYRTNTQATMAIGRLWISHATNHMTVEIAEISLWTPELTFAQIQQL